MANVQITEIDTTGSGQIPEGAFSIGVINIGAGPAYISTIEGQGLVPAGSTKTFPPLSKTYDILNYNAAGTRLLITVFK